METTPNSNIHRIVMRRVHLMHALGPFVNSATLAAVVCAGALYLIGRKVWVARVFANMPSMTNVLAVVRFWLAAFIHTSVTVEVLSLIALAAVLWAAYDALRSLHTPYRYRFAS